MFILSVIQIKLMRKILISSLLLIGCFIPFSTKAQNASKKQSCSKPNNTNTLTQYVGRYKQSNSSIAIVKIINGQLILRPLFWRSEQTFRPKNVDEFVHEEREGRQIVFQRNEKGCVESVKIIGLGRDDGFYQRLEIEQTPLEMLFAGKAKLAAEKMVQNNPNGVMEFVGIARQLLQKFSSKKNDAVIFLNVLAKHYPNNSAVFSALGDAQIAVGNRLLAKENYLKAFKFDREDESALRGLQKLKAIPTDITQTTVGWTVPFSLDEVFKKPTNAEIAEVEADWKQRDLSPKDVIEVAKGRINLGSSDATVRIISHRVHGEKHYGAIIIPDGIEKCAPLILDLKGVSWNYFPLVLNDIISPKILGAEQEKFIYVVPSFRGETLKFNGVDYLSEGDRTDSWDGATDDTLALLNAALSITPQADANRICAFGKSRGGSVALLAGIRNPKIKQVLNWAGPVDWFELMGTEGWTQKEIVSEGMFNKSAPNQEGGQFIERYMLKAMEGKWNLSQVRLKMLAGSPIYFTKYLPQLQAHYGIEDEMVPIVNGQMLSQKMKKTGRTSAIFTSFFHASSGHDLNQRIAFEESKKYLMLLVNK